MSVTSLNVRQPPLLPRRIEVSDVAGIKSSQVELFNRSKKNSDKTAKGVISKVEYEGYVHKGKHSVSIVTRASRIYLPNGYPTAMSIIPVGHKRSKNSSPMKVTDISITSQTRNAGNANTKTAAMTLSAVEAQRVKRDFPSASPASNRGSSMKRIGYDLEDDDDDDDGMLPHDRCYNYENILGLKIEMGTTSSRGSYSNSSEVPQLFNTAVLYDIEDRRFDNNGTLPSLIPDAHGIKMEVANDHV